MLWNPASTVSNSKTGCPLRLLAKDIFKKDAAAEEVDLDKVINGKTTEPRKNDRSYLVLNDTGALLGSKKHIRLQGSEGGMIFKKRVSIWGNSKFLISTGDTTVEKMNDPQKTPHILAGLHSGISINSEGKKLELAADKSNSITVTPTLGVNIKTQGQAVTSAKLIKLA